MYHVHSTGVDDDWRIVDDKQTLLFVGTKQQSEDWLDFQENAQWQSSIGVVSLRRAVEGWMRILRRILPAMRSFLGNRPITRL